MTFVRLDKNWFKLDTKPYNDKGLYKIYNFNGGYNYCYPDFVDQTLNCKDWHELYLLTGFCPLLTNYTECDAWIDPNGNFYRARAHEVAAEEIFEILYGIKDNIFASGDELIEKGWIKVTTSLMYELYWEDHMYNYLTKEQEKSFNLWRKYHNK
jgi:hypothetical protein